MKTLIVIPAYNESENIERVVNNIQNNFPQYDYVIINDGSGDNTAEICKKNNYNLIDLPVNLGLAAVPSFLSEIPELVRLSCMARLASN